MKAKQIEWRELRAHSIGGEPIPFDIWIEPWESSTSDKVFFSPHFGYVSGLGHDTEESAKQWAQECLNTFINSIAE